MPRWTWVLLVLPCVLTGCGCNKPPVPASVAHKEAPIDPWVLICTDPTVDTPALLWNGQIGFRLDRMATGIDESRPMFCIDEYDVTGEEKIRPLVNPVGLDVSRNLDLDPSQPYAQRLDMRTGILTTAWHSSSGATVTVQTVLHPTERMIGERWEIHAPPGTRFSLACVCGDRGTLPDSKDPKKGVWKLGPSDMKVVVRQDCDADSPEWQFMRAGTRFDGVTGSSGVVRYLRILNFESDGNAALMAVARTEAATAHSDDDFPDVPESHWAYKDLAKPESPPQSFDRLISEARSVWEKRWRTDVEIDGPVADQQAVRSFLFYLRSAIDPDGDMSISPFGLSSDRYNGHVFWDADIWVFPALAFIDPQEARAIPKYRLALQAAAMKNAAEWWDKGRPTATGQVDGASSAFLEQSSGIKYPWESSVTGRETCRAPMKFEEHITGSVAFSLAQAASLGLAQSAAVDRVRTLAMWHYLERAEGGSIKGVVSPDESHVGDNDLYTNLLAQWCVYGGRFDAAGPFSTWSIRLPHDSTSLLTYDRDSLKAYKQAAAVTSIYPLQYPPAEKQAKVMMNRFGSKVIETGPSMTDSLHALIWARIGEDEKAYETWEMSWRDFVKEPFLLFSEKRNKPLTYFTTGAAGCLQTVLYGFLGFRIDSSQQDGAAWSMPLALGKILSVKPNLPNAWKSVKFKNFTVMGRRYTLVATHKGVHVTQGDQ